MSKAQQKKQPKGCSARAYKMAAKIEGPPEQRLAIAKLMDKFCASEMAHFGFTRTKHGWAQLPLPLEGATK